MKFGVFLITSICIVFRCASGYIFQMETIEYVYPTNLLANFEHPFERSSLKHKQHLCLTAKYRAGTDWANPVTVSMRVDVLGIVYPNGRHIHQTVLKCPTIPRLYLRLEFHEPTRSFNTIRMMERKNEFMHPTKYRFAVELYRQIEYRNSVSQENLDSGSDGDRDTPLLESSPFLLGTTSYQRLKLCIAAKRRLEPLDIVLLPEEWIASPSKFEVVYPSGRRTEPIAIMCHSRPIVYLRLSNEENQIVVMVREAYSFLTASSPST